MMKRKLKRKELQKRPEDDHQISVWITGEDIFLSATKIPGP